MLKMMLKVSSALRLAFGKCSRRIPSKVDARTFLPEEISAFLFTRVMNSRCTDVVQRWCMFTTRFSLFKAVLFSAKMRKARERERERVGSWERAGEFCRRCFVLCGMPREGGKRQKRLQSLSWK